MQIMPILTRHGDKYKNKSGYSTNIPDSSDICYFVFLGSRNPEEYEAMNITLLYSSLCSLSAYAPVDQLFLSGISRGGFSSY